MDFDPTHFEKYRLEPADILVSEGQTPELLGQSAIYRGGGIEGLCFQKTLHRFRTMSSGVSPELAQIVFRANVKTGIYMKLGSITTNIAHLTREKFVASRFPLPPLEEQARIVAEVARRMSFADALERTVERQITRAQQLRRALLGHAFDGKLLPHEPAAQPSESLRARHADEASASRRRQPHRRTEVDISEEEATS
jgi:type I restriction enzyme S subunit